MAIISGGAWPNSKASAGPSSPRRWPEESVGSPHLRNKFYRHDGSWEGLYSEDFTAAEKKTIIESLARQLRRRTIRSERVWGEVIEDRGSQITFSALGQQAPLEEKKKWDPDFTKRKKIKAVLDTLIPEFSVRLGGATSVDVTKQGSTKPTEFESSETSSIYRLTR